MTSISMTMGKNPLEEMEQPSQSTKESKMQYLGADLKMKELQKRDLNDPDNHGDVNTHLESNILQSELKWALGSITMNEASGGDEIPAKLFQVPKDDAVKVLYSKCQKIWKTQKGATGLEKISFHSNPKESQCQRMFKPLHNCTHLTHQQSNAQNSPSEISTVREPRTSRCSSWIQKRQRNRISNC